MMRWIYKIPLRLRSLFRKGRVERELSDELRFHLQKQTDHNIAAGMSAEEARYAALRAFGGVEQIKEECREALGVRFLNELAQDIRYGLRQLRRNPGFTIVAVLTLALGIGANAAIFSVVNTVLIYPLPFKNSGQLLMLWQRVPHFGTNALTTPDFLAWKRQTAISITAIVNEGFNIGEGSVPEHVPGSAVSGNLFQLLGVRPVNGRSFGPEEDEPRGTRVVILSNGLWQRDFGGDPSALGKTLDLDGKPYTVIGIMPRNYWSVLQPGAQLWVPLRSAPTLSSTRQNHSVHWLLVVGRLKGGRSLKQGRGGNCHCRKSGERVSGDGRSSGRGSGSAG